MPCFAACKKKSSFFLYLCLQDILRVVNLLHSEANLPAVQPHTGPTTLAVLSKLLLLCISADVTIKVPTYELSINLWENWCCSSKRRKLNLCSHSFWCWHRISCWLHVVSSPLPAFFSFSSAYMCIVYVSVHGCAQPFELFRDRVCGQSRKVVSVLGS